MKKQLLMANAVLVFVVLSMFLAPTVYATNGMNLEGYGPIATGMGGASMAYDNGSAAVMNNPATLGMMPQGNRLDVALGILGPNITSEMTGMSDAKSSANAFFMPALGWVNKTNSITYGMGMFAQGGMGAKYAADSFLAYGSGDIVRSEISVGRLLVPFAYEIDRKLSIAATLDYVWVGMDLKMALSGAQFVDMAAFPLSTQTYGTVSGSMMDTFASLAYGGGAFPAGTINPTNPVNWGRFDFSDSSAFTGKAKGTGFGGKLGGVYKVSRQLAIGATYHSKTALSDLKTSDATVSFNANVDTGVAGGGPPSGTYMAATIPLTGKIEVKDFEWPQMAGIGLAYQASDKLMIVADYKWINWEAVMKSFKMTFTADAGQPGMASAFDNTELDATMFQKWKDQHVIMIGAAYRVSANWMLRTGLNYSNNPIPDTYLNALFPAIETTHITLGAGYLISRASTMDASFTYAPEAKQTSGANAPAGATVAHSQMNAQLMYSYWF